MKEIKKVAIVGAGALGSMYGHRLTQSLGRENVFFLADEQRVKKYEEEGVYLNGRRCPFRFVSYTRQQEQADLVLFAVKFPALEEACHQIKPFIHEDTVLISVLNGIESENVIGKILGEPHLLYCVVHGMDALKENNVRSFANMGTVVFGDVENRTTADVAMVKTLFDKAGIQYEIPGDILHKMWSKLMINTGVNQVAAVFESDFGGIQKEGKIRKMTIDVMKEVQKVAAFEKVTLADEEIGRWMQIIDSLNPKGMPSLRQDTKAGRKTEVELFAGTICRLGRKYGIETPLNDFLLSEIRKIELGYLLPRENVV